MNSDRCIILFDIDHTLLNTVALRTILPKDSETWKTAPIPFGQYLYEEVPEVLARVSVKFRLGIESQATHLVYQLRKLHGMGLDSYFKQEELLFIDIDLDKLIASFSLISNDIAYIVDDRPDKLDRIKMRYPHIKTVRVLRGKYESDRNGYKADFDLHDLRGLYTILGV